MRKVSPEREAVLEGAVGSATRRIGALRMAVSRMRAVSTPKSGPSDHPVSS
jgi:hypothetical protein